MTLSKDVISKILKLYEPCNGNIAEAAREFERLYYPELGYTVSGMTIKNYWIKEGHALNPHGGRRVALQEGKRGALTKKEIEEIIEDHDLFDGNAERAEREKKKYAQTTYLRCWKKANLKIGRWGKER